jgi:flagellar biosynthesis/type III secretory pathway chaperone
MESVKDLVEILKSQILLYEDMKSILEAEKECVVTWDADKTIELVKRKDTLSYKEKVLDEAFRNSLKKIEKDSGRENLRVQDIDAAIGGEYTSEIQLSRSKLIALINSIQDLNTSLKLLYKTNISLIDGVFSRLGLAGKNTYGVNKGYTSGRTSTISRTG